MTRHDPDTMTGRTVLVTGATDGIGRETALELARVGARVVVHGRDRDRVETTRAAIVAATGNEAVETAVADLASQRAVRALSAEIHERFDLVHVLVNNAGVYMHRRVLTEDGLETTFAVNHLAPFLLTRLLLDRLAAAARGGRVARVVTVSSVAHQRGVVDLGNLQGERVFSPYGSYALSKLCNVLFTIELAERLRDSGVTANTLHPGVVATKLLRAGFGSMGGSVAEGARTPVFLASSPEVEQVSGRYFVGRQPVEPAPPARDRASRKALWALSEKLTGTIDVPLADALSSDQMRSA
jgi:NAD(P)-dependent dehydrogenase (short-subunit alcohol dehydrogenase family)